MQALRFIEPGSMELTEVPEPDAPSIGEVLVRTHQVGVCGTDISGFLGKHPFFSYPRIPGHELGVEVLEIGPQVENVRPGDRCAVEPYMNNPDSFASRRGLANCCQDVEVIGIHIDGGLRAKFLIRADKLHKSESLTYEQLALVETLAIGCHAASRTDPVAGDLALVIGAGPIGCSIIEFLKLRGCHLTVMDLNVDRLNSVKKMYNVSNAICPSEQQDEFEAMREITGGELYTHVIDATGSPKSMGQAPNYVRHGGQLIFVGNTTQEITFNPTSLQKPEITLKCSRNALPEDFRFIINAIEVGQIDTAPWITHRTTLNEVVDVFESYTRSETGVLKAMISI